MMLSPLVPGCTRSLAPAIAAARARHAAESIDFHTFFDSMTVAAIQDVLHGAAPADGLVDPRARRKELVEDLLQAQQENPHPLWTLLLLVAFERDLVRYRAKLPAQPNEALDALVVETFVATVKALPYEAAPEVLRGCVLRAWNTTLRHAMRDRTAPPAAPIPVPPPSGVASTGDADDSTEVA